MRDTPELVRAIDAAGFVPTIVDPSNPGADEHFGAVVLDAASLGEAAMARLLRHPMFVDVPRLVVGRSRDDEPWGLAARVGADEGIRRPLDARELAGRLSALVELRRVRSELALFDHALGCAETEIAQLACAVQDRDRFTTAILDGIATAIVVTDVDEVVSFANRAACTLLATTSDALLGTSAHEALKLPGEHERASVHGQPAQRSMFVLHRADGAALKLGVSTTRTRYGDVIVLREIEERLTDPHSQRVDRLAAMGTMATGFAHEVRNPLASLRILSEGLAAEIDADDSRLEFVRRILKQLERIERLVKTSLQFGRPDPPRRADRNPSAILSAALEAILPRTREMGDAIRVEASADVRSVFVDDAQIVQVLVTLLNNALDATGRPDRVTLRVLDAPVRFEVADEGPGIPNHVLARIFEPFFTTKPAGTGLGLAIAQQIVQENGGRIEVSSAQGRGATFTVTLPGGEP